MKRRGFTLIELLTVIAIIAILSAILFPVLAMSRRNARNSACMSNLKQIGTSLHLYGQDANGFYPFAVDPTDKYTPQIWTLFFNEHKDLVPQGVTNVSQWLSQLPMLQDVLLPYHNSKEVWKCPNDFGFDVVDTNGEYLNARPSCYRVFGTSYLYRTEISFRRILVDSFDNGAAINVMFDANGSWHTGAKQAQTPFEIISNVQNYRYNVLYGDLHVKSANYDELQSAWATPLMTGMTP